MRSAQPRRYSWLTGHEPDCAYFLGHDCNCKLRAAQGALLGLVIGGSAWLFILWRLV